MTTHRKVKFAAVIHAVDPGEEMVSTTPKYLHHLLGRELIQYAISSAQEATGEKPFLILGTETEQISAGVQGLVQDVILENGKSDRSVLRNTKTALPEEMDFLLVTGADRPLVTSTTLERLIASHLQGTSQNSPLTLLTSFVQQDGNSNPVLRDEGGELSGIGISDHLQPGQSITQEVSVDIYCITTDWLWQVSDQVSPPFGSQFLIDLVKVAIAEGLPINTINVENSDEALRVETRLDLAEAESILRQQVNRKMMINGVTIIDPPTTYIEPEVEIGADSIIMPNTHLTGITRIGGSCVIGPNTYIQDSNIGDRCRINNSVVEEATLEDNVDIGPFAHLRKGAYLAEGVHMGNFGEVKNSYLGQGAKMGHFSYVGDATVGPEVNIGAGVITANYDGQRKHPTEIGPGAFIGSDTMLIAPLKIGEGARTGAGSVVTKDVPAHSLAVGMPARIIHKKEEDDGP
jgi:bifunctional UDP-N-acetylglucosamine pyrophosphorylase/glucosamine-1-phosphate N-acetyltransferase